jgi:hypothetical protein
MSTARLLALLVAGLAVASGCASAAGPSPSTPPASSPAPSVESGVDHPTGPTDVVLRYEEGGGFMPVEWSLASVPIFTLYGDGTVIYRNPDEQAPPDESGLLVYRPLNTTRLSEAQMAELLAFAVSEGGLAGARDRYDNPMLADAGNAIFTLNAGGRTKVVTVAGLLESDTTAPDQLSRAQFKALAERLRGFEPEAGGATAVYAPTAYRVHLMDAGQAQPAIVHPWPWPDLTPTDFTAGSEEPTAPGFPQRSMTVDEVSGLEVDGIEGGLMGYYVKGPDGRLYSLVVRPLLPGDED